MKRSDQLVPLLLFFLLPLVAGQEPDKPTLSHLLGKVAVSKPGDPGKPGAILAARVLAVQGDKATAAAMAVELAAHLGKEDATLTGRRFICRQLSLIGGAAQVPILARYLVDHDLSQMARYALERIPGPEAIKALIAAAATTTGPNQLGLIHTLGQRQDPTAIPVLTALTKATARATAMAATRALAACHGPLPPGLNNPVCNQAQLIRARTLARAGKTDQAKSIFMDRLDFANPGAIRLAALHGLTELLANQAAPLLLETLAEADLELARAAAVLLRHKRISAKDLQTAIATQFDQLAPDRQALLLHALGERREAQFLPLVRKAANTGNITTRKAAYSTLGKLGNKADVPLLIKILATGKPLAAIATRALRELPDPAVDPAILSTLNTVKADKPLAGLLTVLTFRHSPNAFPHLVGLLKTRPAKLHKKIFSALGQLTGAKHFPQLLKLNETTTAKNRKLAARAVAKVCLRLPEAQGCAILMSVLHKATGKARAAYLPILPLVGGPRALTVLRKNLQSATGETRDTALRALCSWPETAALEDLLALARKEKKTTTMVLAIRGAVRLVRKAASPHKDRFAQLETLLQTATRSAEKKLVMAALGELKYFPALQKLNHLHAQPKLKAAAAAALNKLAGSMEKWVSETDLPEAKKIISAINQKNEKK